MKYVSIVIMTLLSLPVITHAQQSKGETGIRFEQGLTWEQVKEKAKKENKYIFVDCYTTWCLPCKQMEKFIYPDEKVGDFFNQNFISVKVQIDQTGHDDSNVKAWYQAAKFIESEYKVIAYPTFLFFSPGGKIVHRAAGAYPVNQFITLGKNAKDPTKQYYMLLASYKPAQMDTAQLKVMALKYRTAGPELAGMIVNEYFRRLDEKEKWKKENLNFLREFQSIETVKPIADSYINSLKEEDIFTNENIHLLSSFTKSSTDSGFKIFYLYPDKADSAMGQERFARNKVMSIIIKEEITPQVDKAKLEKMAPDWKGMANKIEKKYGKDYALSSTLREQIDWFANQGDIESYRKMLIEYFDYFVGWEDNFFLNNYAWYFFQKVNDPVQLRKALTWSQESLRLFPNAEWMDTYANLLYKLGEKKHAILWEQIAVTLDTTARKKEKEEILAKMKAGQPTWPVTK